MNEQPHPPIFEDRFADGLNPLWEVTQIGTGRVRPSPGALWLTTHPTRDVYTNAQITDYRYGDYNFRWQPPLRLTVTAWAAGAPDALRGTAGFGFWNHPFSPDVKRIPRRPQAIWFFFASPPSNMALAYDVPGFGWKAATIDTTRPTALPLIPLAFPAVLLMKRPALYARIWPYFQRTLKIDERLLDLGLLAERHTYVIDWRRDGARFGVDGATVLETDRAPHGAAGFVAWLDNQYAVVTPQGEMRFGLVPIEQEQSLILESVAIEC